MYYQGGSMSLIKQLEQQIFGGDNTLDLHELTLDRLEQEKAGIRTDVKLKRERHQDLSKDREQLFEKIVETDDELLKKEVAQEIASIEDERAILHNEHTQLMDGLRVIDGLIAIKRKEKMAERQGLLSQIQEMEKDDLVEKLRQTDVRELIREEKWDQLNSLLSGQLSPKQITNERVDEIIRQAEDIKQLEEDMGKRQAVQHALRGRDVDVEAEQETVKPNT